MYFYPDRPPFIPLDNSDLIEKYITYERNGVNGAIESLLSVYPEFEESVNNKIMR